MNAGEARALANATKAAQMNEYRSDVIVRIKAAAQKGHSNLLLQEQLSVDDTLYFRSLGYEAESFKDYSEISWE